MNAKQTIFRIGLASFFLLYASTSRAEEISTILRGVTVLQNSNGATLENVEISAAFCECVGENPTFSDEYGLFQFEIKGKAQGETVELKVKKEGYEVVNQDDLTPYLRKNPDDLVKIVLCPAGERDRTALRFYNIVAENVRAQEPDAKTAEAVIAFAQEFTKTLAEKNLDEMSPEYRKAIEFFQAGNIAQAKQALKDAQMADELRNAQEELRKAQERLRQLENAGQPNAPQSEMLAPYPLVASIGDLAGIVGVSAQDDAALRAAQEAERRAKDDLRKSVENYMLKARLCVADLQFDDAEKYYRIATDADPENFENLHEFALYLHRQNQFLRALPLYEKALTLAKDDGYIAKTLNNLGLLYNALNEYDNAADAYERALAICEKFVANNTSTYKSKLAETLDNLGNLYSDLNDYNKASEFYERALIIREELASTNPTVYKPDMATTLNNWAGLYWSQNQYDKAADFLKRALQIREELAVSNPQIYQPYLANTLNNLGNLYSDLKDYTKATNAYERALAIRERLAADNPQAYELDLCMTMVNMSYLYQILYERDPKQTYKIEGLALAERAIKILQKYPDIPQAQEDLDRANFRKAFFEQAGAIGGTR